MQTDRILPETNDNENEAASLAERERQLKEIRASLKVTIDRLEAGLNRLLAEAEGRDA